MAKDIPVVCRRGHTALRTHHSLGRQFRYNYGAPIQERLVGRASHDVYLIAVGNAVRPACMDTFEKALPSLPVATEALVANDALGGCQ